MNKRTDLMAKFRVTIEVKPVKPGEQYSEITVTEKPDNIVVHVLNDDWNTEA